ncbi:MAG: XRE family transcriptional regulator [Myxococcales bacterium]|nr:XRE family transcriptional regulator [Myxococcales bacterium]
MIDDIARNLADNLRALREARGFSQQQIAKLAGLPRPTWANLESGSANPTVSVLTRAAAALQVRVDELLAPPRTQARHYPSGTLPTRSRGRVRIRKLLPESMTGLDIERMDFPAGSSMTGIPHTVGTREYLTCERGTLELTASGEHYTLAPGDVMVFRGDQKHGYRNPGPRICVAYSVIAFAPTAG